MLLKEREVGLVKYEVSLRMFRVQMDGDALKSRVHGRGPWSELQDVRAAQA